MSIVIHVMRLPLLQLKTPLLLLPTIVGRARLPLLRPSAVKWYFSRCECFSQVHVLSVPGMQTARSALALRCLLARFRFRRLGLPLLRVFPRRAALLHALPRPWRFALHGALALLIHLILCLRRTVQACALLVAMLKITWLQPNVNPPCRLLMLRAGWMPLSHLLRPQLFPLLAGQWRRFDTWGALREILVRSRRKSNPVILRPPSAGTPIVGACSSNRWRKLRSNK